MLALLDLLKDDPALYVRRSVANNLNDIGKDNPRALADTARRWMHGASAEREWMLRHALRYAIKNGEPWALELLGFGRAARVEIGNASVTPRCASIGGAVTIAFDLRNPRSRAQDLLVDFQVHYVKANGAPGAKVFKLKSLRLAGGATAHLQKTLSLVEMSTRKHYPGTHAVDVLLNGRALPLGSFELLSR